MRALCIAAAITALAGCGVETGGAIKAKEMEEAKKTQERAQQKIDQATQLLQQRAQQSGSDASR